MAPSNPNKPNNGFSDKPTKDSPAANAHSSRFVKALEGFEDKVMGADASKYSQSASDFYSKNKDEFSKTASRLASNPDVQAMEEKVKNFAASSQVLMNVLDDVRRVHPFIDVAVLAFKAVVTLELKRRDNDQKVIVLQVKMQDMMEVFVQLRVIAPKQKEASQKYTVEERLSRLCEGIADDIRSCGNLCDAYSKKRLLVQILKSPIYEARLADFANSFSERQKELELALQVFTAHGVSVANEALADVQGALRSTQESIKLLFEKLQTPLEQELRKLIDSKGGPDKCAKDDEALKELIVLRLYGKDSSEKPDHQASTYPVPPSYIPSPYYGAGVPSPYPVGMSSAMMSPPLQGGYVPTPPLQSQLPRSSSLHMQSRRSRSRNQSSSYYSTQGDRSQMSRSYPSHVQSPPRASSPTRVSRSAYATPQAPIVEPTPLPTVKENGSFMEAEPIPRPAAEGTQTNEPPPFLINDLKDELSQDVDADLEKNMQIFLRKLNVQEKQLKEIERAVVRQGDRMISAFREGPHDRVTDPELRSIWKEMGWKLCVPVHEFVLTLHDYFLAKYSDSELLDDYFNRTPSPGSTAREQTLALRKAMSAAKSRAAEKWALKHISMANIIPLKEVFDGDASGYVSVWEANQIASLRPKDWSFLQWLAYWAAGRHFAIWKYRQKIYSLLKQMHKLLDQVLPTNRSIVDRYISSLFTIEQILSSTRPCNDELEDSLKDKVIVYQHAEEQAMERKLEALNYEIDGPDTLGLIIGRSEIERNLFPLLYLLLKHHLAAIQLGHRVVLDRDELLVAEQTLEHIYDAIESRISTLEINASQNLSLVTNFATFAFGMYAFYTSQQSPYSFWPAYPEDTESDEDLEESTVGVLKNPSPHMVDSKHDDFDVLDIESCISGVEGFWTGHLFDSGQNSVHGMIQLRIDTWNFTNGRIRGRGSYSKGTLIIEGRIQLGQQHGTLEATLLGQPDYEKDPKLHLFIRGNLHILREVSQRTSISRSLPTQYTISGEWGQKRGSPLGSLYLSQTPAWVHRFKPLITSDQNRARSLWQFAYNAIVHQVRSRHGFLDRAFITSKLSELRRGAELTRYQYLLDVLSPLDQKEMDMLLLTSTPWDARIYRSIARSHFFWASMHYSITCSTCSRVILGPRFQDLTPGFPADLCKDCFRRGDYRRHEGIFQPFAKLTHFLHDREASSHAQLAYALAMIPEYNARAKLGIPYPTEDEVSFDTPPIFAPTHRPSTPAWTPPSPPPEPRPGWSSPTKHVRFALSLLKSSGASTTSNLPLPPFQERPPSIPSGVSQAPATAGSTLDSVGPEADNGAVSAWSPGVDEPPTVLQCICCDSDVQLLADMYWVCIKCYELENTKFVSFDRYKVVICLDCELHDRPPLRDGVGHNIAHSLVRLPEHPPSMSVWPPSHRRSGSKRRMVIDFLKGVFRSKEPERDEFGQGPGPSPYIPPFESTEN